MIMSGFCGRYGTRWIGCGTEDELRKVHQMLVDDAGRDGRKDPHELIIRPAADYEVAEFKKQVGHDWLVEKSGLHDDRCASRKGYPCNCASAAFPVQP